MHEKAVTAALTSETMRSPFVDVQIRLERGHSRTSFQYGGLPNLDMRGKFMAVIQLIPKSIMRALKLVILGLMLFLLFLCLPSRRPYTSDLILRTSDMIDTMRSLQSDDAAKILDSAQPITEYLMNCDPDFDTLREIRDRYELDDEIEYFKRHVRFSRKPIERESYTTLQQHLLPGADATDKTFQVLDLSTDSFHAEKCYDPLEVSVPESRFPNDVDLTDYIFAISTTINRVNHPTTIQEWSYWLTDGKGKSNGGKLLVRLLDASDPEIGSVAERLAGAGIDAEVSAWDSRIQKEMAVRYLNLVPMLFNHESSAAKKWFVLCDDDTFFTAMNSLTERLKRYDHTKPLYIGTLSENFDAVKTHGSQAFGGAGLFLSRPLASIISNTTIFESCKSRKSIRESDSGWGPQGDILLRKCIYENTNVRLTDLRELWQLDIVLDASGFYESGMQPYSIHHFKGGKKWHTAYPLNTTKIAYTCGEDCPYMRFITADNFIISNGYSIAQYPEGIDFDLDQVEQTFHALWGDKGWNFDYKFGPQRPSLQRTGKKIAWELRESQNRRDGSVSQVYIRKKDDWRWVTEEGEPMRELDGVMELVWIPA